MPNPKTFQRGDIVRLNYGGPVMAIEEVEDKTGKIVRCKWFEDGARHVRSYYADAVHRYNLP